jgi:hypothetical protein
MIGRLGDADYQDALPAVLRHVAGSLDKRVELRFVSASRDIDDARRVK